MSDGAALGTGAEVIKDTTTTDQSTIPASDGNNSPDSTNADSSDNDALWSPGLSLAWRNFDPIVVLDMKKQGRERWARKMMEAENAEARELQRFNQIFETKTGTPSPPSSSTHPRSL
jgi:hypothetical protein